MMIVDPNGLVDSMSSICIDIFNLNEDKQGMNVFEKGVDIKEIFPEILGD